MDKMNVATNYADKGSVNLVDIFKYLVFHWKWFLISILIFVGYFGYQYCKTPFTYNRSVTVMIKTPANSQGTMRMNRYNSFMAPVNVASEILQFKSRELLRRTIDKLHTDVSYSIKNNLRYDELYTNSPIRVSFLNVKGNKNFSFKLVPVNNDQVILSDFSVAQNKKMTVNFNDTVITPVGLAVIYKSDNYKSHWFGKDLYVKKYSRESMVDFFMSNLSITQLEQDAAILHISMSDYSSLRATDMLNMLVTAYNEAAVQDKNRVALNTEEFIKDRLAIIEKELGTVETDIESLKTANEGVDVNTSAEMFISDSRQYQSAVKALDTQLNLVGFMKQFLQDPSKSDDLIPHNTGLVDINIENQITQYNNAVLKKNRLVEGSSERNPIVQELDRSIIAMRQNIVRAVDNMISSLQIKKRDQVRQGDVAREKVQAVPKEQRLMLSMERKQKVKEELYIFLLNKREENALNQAMADENARLIDSASGSVAPISPNMYKKLLLGVGCGIAVPTVILLLILMLDTSVRSRKDLENVLTIPFLGDIPLAVDKKLALQGVVVTPQGRDAVTEAFRMLRTNLGFMFVNQQNQKVIALTSFGVGAGKTFVSLNLASSLTQIKSRVILLDLDLRKGTASFHIHHKIKRKGVTHYLSDLSVQVDDIILTDSVYGNFDVITVGAIVPNPAELLLSARLDMLISELKKRYDYIIIDGVPMGVVADASIINRIVDLTFFVVRAGCLDRRLLPELERLYEEKKFNNMAVLLNATKKGSSVYDSGYGYGYGYGAEHVSWKHKIKKFFVGKR